MVLSLQLFKSTDGIYIYINLKWQFGKRRVRKSPHHKYKSVMWIH